jgi:hypothetical protein
MDVRCNISSSMAPGCRCLHARTHAGFDAVPPAALENDLYFRRTACRRRGRIEGGEIGRWSELAEARIDSVGKNPAEVRIDA